MAAMDLKRILRIELNSEEVKAYTIKNILSGKDN
jgi:hypothetical protein